MPGPIRPLDSGIPKPKNLKELFPYLYRACSGFFSRLFYIISLVFKTAPHLFVLMCLICVVEGVLPVVGAYISREEYKISR